jgi:hypothetical protein
MIMMIIIMIMMIMTMVVVVVVVVVVMSRQTSMTTRMTTASATLRCCVLWARREHSSGRQALGWTLSWLIEPPGLSGLGRPSEKLLVVPWRASIKVISAVVRPPTC